MVRFGETLEGETVCSVGNLGRGFGGGNDRGNKLGQDDEDLSGRRGREPAGDKLRAELCGGRGRTVCHGDTECGEIRDVRFGECGGQPVGQERDISGDTDARCVTQAPHDSRDIGRSRSGERLNEGRDRDIAGTSHGLGEGCWHGLNPWRGTSCRGHFRLEGAGTGTGLVDREVGEADGVLEDDGTGNG
jgi:hypothetical protein